MTAEWLLHSPTFDVSFAKVVCPFKEIHWSSGNTLDSSTSWDGRLDPTAKRNNPNPPAITESISLPYQHIKLKSSPSSPADSGRCTHQNGIKNALHHQLQWDTGRFLLITWWLFLSWIAIMLIPRLVLKPYTKTRDNHIRSSPQKPWKLVTSRWFFHVFSQTTGHVKS